MAHENFYLSNFGLRYLLVDYDGVRVIPTEATVEDELQGIYSCTLGEINKEVTKKRTLNGNGWETVAVLGNSQGDGSFDAVRLGVGNAYVGKTGEDTYTRIRDWFMKATSNGGIGSPKTIIEIVDRGTQLEGTVYNVLPTTWGPGTKDTDTGQEYSFTVTPFGAPIPVKVTHVNPGPETPESWGFELTV